MADADSNRDAVVIMTAALSAVPEIRDPEVAGRFRSDILIVLREYETPDQMVNLIASLATNTSALLVWLADELGTTPESILQLIALTHAERQPPKE